MGQKSYLDASSMLAKQWTQRVDMCTWVKLAKLCRVVYDVLSLLLQLLSHALQRAVCKTA